MIEFFFFLYVYNLVIAQLVKICVINQKVKDLNYLTYLLNSNK